MDTKWKRFKGIICFICFYAGVTMVLGTVLSLFSAFVTREYNPAEIVDGDYQNTEAFQSCISNWLSDAIDMAVGNPVGTAYWDYYGYYDEWTVMQDDIIAGSSQYGTAETPWNDELWGLEEGKETAPEENRKMADWMHTRMEPNKNILYSIAYDGNLLYSNTDNLRLDELNGNMPEGYNFLLHFDGSRVEIVKDGQPLDIYGDGYYREDSGWYVPGYENFTTGEKVQKADIYIAVAQEPKRYIYSKSGQAGYRQAEDQLYWIQQILQEDRARLAGNLLFFAAGVLLLTVSCFQKDGKRRREEAVAGFLNRIWLEAKILFGAVIFLLAVIRGAAAGNYQGSWEYIVMSTQEITSYYGWSGTYLVSEILEESIRLIFMEPSVLVILFWLIYLAVLDIRKNRSVWKQSLTARAVKLLSAKELQMPFAKRLVHRCIPGMIATILLCVAALAAAIMEKNSYLLLLSAALAILAIGIQCCHICSTKKLAGDMDRLIQRIKTIHGGQYESGGETPGSQDLTEVFTELEHIRQGMSKAIEEQVKSQRLKVELIANVSHDIKTPLTSIISYIEFLKQEEGLPEHVRDYIRILDEKSQRLKNMIQDVFSVSKAATGQLTVNMEHLDFGKLLRQTLADMDEQIHGSRVTVKAEIPEEPVMIRADGQKMYRVFQNLIQNALKYSLEGSRVYVTLKTDGGLAVAGVKNTSRQEIDQNKDFTERFVRGDESRTDGGSGLGLSIARNFTEACGGTFKLETIADLFLVTVSFKTAVSEDSLK